MRRDRPAVARRIAAAGIVVAIVATAAAYAGDAPPGPPAWVAVPMPDTAPVTTAARPASPLAEPLAAAAATATTAMAPAHPAGAAVKPATIAKLTVNTPAGNTPAGNTISQAESQGLGCMTLGTLSSIGVFVYSDVIATVVGGVGQSLLAPAMALGFAVGCNVGVILAPGIAWLASH